MSIYSETLDGRAVSSVKGYVIAAEDRRISDKLSILSLRINSSSKIPNWHKGLLDAYGKPVDELVAEGKTYYVDSIVQAELKFDEREKWLGKITKGDLVKVYGTVGGRTFRKKDGTLGFSFEFQFINKIEKFDEGGNVIDPMADDVQTPW